MSRLTIFLAAHTFLVVMVSCSSTCPEFCSLQVECVSLDTCGGEDQKFQLQTMCEATCGVAEQEDTTRSCLQCLVDAAEGECSDAAIGRASKSCRLLCEDFQTTQMFEQVDDESAAFCGADDESSSLSDRVRGDTVESEAEGGEVIVVPEEDVVSDFVLRCELASQRTDRCHLENEGHQISCVALYDTMQHKSDACLELYSNYFQCLRIQICGVIEDKEVLRETCDWMGVQEACY